MAVKTKHKEINRNTRRAIQPFLLCPRGRFSVFPEADWPVRLSPSHHLGPSPSLVTLLPSCSFSALHPTPLSIPLVLTSLTPLFCLCILGPWVGFQNRSKEDPVLPSNLSIRRLTSLRFVLLRLSLVVVSQSCFVPFILLYPIAATKAMRVICNRQGRSERPASAHWKMLEREV